MCVCVCVIIISCSGWCVTYTCTTPPSSAACAAAVAASVSAASAEALAALKDEGSGDAQPRVGLRASSVATISAEPDDDDDDDDDDDKYRALWCSGGAEAREGSSAAATAPAMSSGEFSASARWRRARALWDAAANAPAWDWTRCKKHTRCGVVWWGGGDFESQGHMERTSRCLVPAPVRTCKG